MKSLSPILLHFFIIGLLVSLSQARDFSINYTTNSFQKDGEAFRLISGSIHYFRVHPADWTDRLNKLRYAGFNAVQTYIEWSSHEKSPGNFSDLNTITDYLKEAQKNDLLVILRPGPYIDAERDMGGLPYWLLTEPEIDLRTSNPSFLKRLSIWYDELLPQIKPLLYSEGGPVVMVQIENEYGDYDACDFDYTTFLRDKFREKLGDDVILYTTDARRPSALRCGVVAEVYPTIDFGPGYNMSIFEVQRLFAPQGPLMNSEYYPGWLDYWGQPHSRTNISRVVTTWEAMLAVNASVNMYMAHGGTSFGLKAGADYDTSYTPQPTSYDYDAPISEAGDLTPKYWAIRETNGKFVSLPSTPEPRNTTKAGYGLVELSWYQDLNQALKYHPSWVETDQPLSFEELGYDQGLVVYTTQINHNTTDPTLLSVHGINDRGYVFIDDMRVGILDRMANITQLPLSARKDQNLTIIVESMGRIDFGPLMKDSKGLKAPVKLGTHQLGGWKQAPLRNLYPNAGEGGMTGQGAMQWFSGSFNITGTPCDTFLRTDGWGKGMAWVNGFMLGRYWPRMGPQLTLYVPHGVLQEGSNNVTLLELQEAPCRAAGGSCNVEFIDTPTIDGPTPTS